MALPKVDAVCTLELARARIPHLPRHTLQVLADFLHLPIAATHRAPADAAILAAILPRLIELPPRLVTTGDLNCCSQLSWEDGDVFPVRPPTQFRLLAEAIEARQRLCILYETQDGQVVDLPITPSFLVNSRGREYLGAFCHIDQTLKTYRLDRVRRVQR
jgi:hypothetical protein